MAGPYRKSQQNTDAIDGGWVIEDGRGELIANLATETMADALFACLLHDPAIAWPAEMPTYPENTKLGAPGDTDEDEEMDELVGMESEDEEEAPAGSLTTVPLRTYFPAFSDTPTGWSCAFADRDAIELERLAEKYKDDYRYVAFWTDFHNTKGPPDDVTWERRIKAAMHALLLKELAFVDFYPVTLQGYQWRIYWYPSIAQAVVDTRGATYGLKAAFGCAGLGFKNISLLVEALYLTCLEQRDEEQAQISTAASEANK